MKLTRLLPDPVEELALDDRWSETLSALYQTPKPRWVRINLIMTVNGNAVGMDGTSNSLTNATDRRILGTIRRHSDIVVVGANSVRKEGYVLPKSVPLAIVTTSGDLRGHRLPSEVEAGRLLVLCPPDAVETLQQYLGSTARTVITLPGPQLDPAAMIAALRQRGYQSIVCEGGPTLAAQLVDAGLVDELCLSTSPAVSEVTVPVLHALSRSTPLRLTQLLVDPESVLYARWAVQRGLAT